MKDILKTNLALIITALLTGIIVSIVAQLFIISAKEIFSLIFKFDRSSLSKALIISRSPIRWNATATSKTPLGNNVSKVLNSKSKSMHASFNESFDQPLKMAWDATAFINFSFSAWSILKVYLYTVDKPMPVCYRAVKYLIH